MRFRHSRQPTWHGLGPFPPVPPVELSTPDGRPPPPPGPWPGPPPRPPERPATSSTVAAIVQAAPVVPTRRVLTWTERSMVIRALAQRDLVLLPVGEDMWTLLRRCTDRVDEDYGAYT